MVPNRITRGAAALRALVLLATAVIAAAGLSACGGGEEEPTVAREKAADAETFNNVLGRQLAAVAAYERTLPLLHGSALASAREFRASEQEHVDATLKALRGLGEAADAEPEEVEGEGLKTQIDALTFLYELESTSIAFYLREISHLTHASPRALIAALANQAQRLVVIRRALGAGVAESIPSAFEDGSTPPPSKEDE